MSAWGIATQHFRNLFESIENELNNPLTEAVGLSRLDVKGSAPESIYNGAYVIQMNGMPVPAEDLNGVIDITYNVRLQIAYEFNSQDDQTTYNNAAEDLETIIKAALNVNNWDSIYILTHRNTSQFLFYGNASNQNFALVNLDFQVTVRDYYTT
jgi:hypothetical protein